MSRGQESILTQGLASLQGSGKVPKTLQNMDWAGKKNDVLRIELAHCARRAFLAHLAFPAHAPVTLRLEPRWFRTGSFREPLPHG